jgi:uncharacterized delta-60 repeat protein
MKKLFLILFNAAACFSCAGQSAGTIDSTFNGTGIYTFDFGFHDNLNDVTMQADQKIICTGVALTPAFSSVMKVMRLHSDGTNGVYSLLLGNETHGYESYVQDDGKILVAGITYDINYIADWMLLRLDSTGVLDPTFGTNGITTLDFEGRDDIADALTVQADGKILVSGTYNDTIDFYNNPTIVRFTADGIVDSTFGTNGKVSVHGLHIDNELTSIEVQQDGKIVAGGHYSTVFTGAMNFDVLVIRVDNTGVLDPSFGVGGVVITPINGGVDDSFGLDIDSNGNVYVAGFTTLPVTLTYDMIIVKYDSTGTPDPGFGNGGIVTFNNSDQDVAMDIQVQPDNKIVVGGSSGAGMFGPRDFAIWRYLSDGTPDITFGTNGFVTTTVLPNFQDCNSITLQADGKIVAAGRANNGSQNDIAVVRYLNDLSSAVYELADPAEVTLFPNPLSQNQVISLVSEKSFSQGTVLEVFSSTGSLVYQSQVNSSVSHITIDASSWEMGIYFIKVIDGNSSVVKQLVKM